MSDLQLVKEIPSNPHNTNFNSAETAAMQRAVINLFQRWGLTDSQACILLGSIGKRTYQRWKDGEFGSVKIDLATRMSILMGIHKALRLLFSDANKGYEWIKKPNQAFANKSALDVMLEGQLTDLIRIRSYLDANRGH